MNKPNFKINKQQLQEIIDDKSSVWEISAPNLKNALKEVSEHLFSKNNREKAENIATKSTLKHYLRNIHKDSRRAYAGSGNAEELHPVWEVFPMKEGGFELLTFKKAMTKTSGVNWAVFARNQRAGSDRAYSAVETMDAFAELAESLI